MQSLLYAKTSDGTANASLMTVQTLRSPGATTAVVNTVSGVPAGGFYASMGAPHTFTDPVTSEVITVISDATAVDFAGHINAGQVIIDAIAPGYVDTRGSLVGDIIIIRPVTEWANNIFNVLNQSLNNDGTLKNTAITYQPTVFDHIASGAVLAGINYGTTLTASLSAGVAYINGIQQIIAAVATRTYTASKDTYVDALYSATGTATIVYTEVANNAASPALAANSIRLGIIITGASNILNSGSVNQGQEYIVLPIASSRAYGVTDSLGNLICPRDPGRLTLGQQQYGGTSLQTSSASFVQFAALVCPVIVPSNGRKVKFTIESSAISCTAQGVWALALYEDGVIIQQWYRNQDTATANNIPVTLVHKKTPTPGLHTYDVRGLVSAGTMTISSAVVNSGAFQPGVVALMVEQA